MGKKGRFRRDILSSSKVHLVLPNEEVALRAGKAGMVDACMHGKKRKKNQRLGTKDGQIERARAKISILSGLTSHGDPVDETGDLICSRILALNLSI